jgi:hypothetical protein
MGPTSGITSGGGIWARPAGAAARDKRKPTRTTRAASAHRILMDGKEVCVLTRLLHAAWMRLSDQADLLLEGAALSTK